MKRKITNKRIIMLSILIMAGALAAALILGPKAHASPYPAAEAAVCDYLDANPTDSGVQIIVMMMVNNGIPTDTGARVIIDAVQNRCPDHAALVYRSAQRHSTAGSKVA